MPLPRASAHRGESRELPSGAPWGQGGVTAQGHVMGGTGRAVLGWNETYYGMFRGGKRKSGKGRDQSSL